MKLRYLIMAGVALLALSSCSDFLDKPSDTRVTLTNTEQLRMLMVSAYPTCNYEWICELSTDNFIDNNTPSVDGVRYNLSSYSRNDDETFAWEDIRSSSDSDSPSDLWESYYNSIATCNHVLEKVEEFEAAGENSEKLQAVKGEALIDRAYCHFMLANIFCMPYRGPELSKYYPGIPYTTKPETTVKPHYERGTLAETYDMIQADIEAGLPLINDSFYEIPKYHFNRQAAYAFASRFYLFKRDYEKVLECCNIAFGGPDVDPMPYMSDIWAQTNLNYAHEYNRYYVNPNHQRNFLVIPTYSRLQRYYGSGCRYGIARDGMRASFQGPGPTWERCRYQITSLGWVFSCHPCHKSWFANGRTEYGVWFGAAAGEQFEYTDKVAGIGYAHQVLAEFTGEELLFNRAEAKLFLGDIDGCIADLGVWDEAHRNTPEVNANTPMDPWSKEIVWKFYTKAEEKFLRNSRPERRDILGNKLLDSIYFGIAKPLHIDEVCPSERFHLTADIEPFLQCIQHLRRFEFACRGMRWFDIKRLGISYNHVIGKDARVETLQVLDPRLAFQIPNEILAAGIDETDRKDPPKDLPTTSPKVVTGLMLPADDESNE
jgi:hypothetical protein